MEVINNSDPNSQQDEKQKRKSKKCYSLLKLFVEYVIPPNYSHQDKKELMKLLVSEDTNMTNEQWRLKNELKYVLPTLLEAIKRKRLHTSSHHTIFQSFLKNHAKEMRNCSETQSLKDCQVVESLLQKGAAIIIYHLEGSGSPLGTAIAKGRVDIVKIMLKHFYDINCKIYTNGYREPILNIIIDNYAKSNDTDQQNYSYYLEVINDLVTRDETIMKEFNVTGWRPVHVAAKHCFIEILQIFKEKEMHFTVLTHNNETSLMLACSGLSRVKDEQEALKIIELLLGEALDVKHKDKFALTCLHYAVQSTHLAVVKRLVEAGADIKVIADDGSTLLHSAAMLGSLEIVQYLIDCGIYAKKPEKNAFEFTLLHAAALNADINIVRLFAKNSLFISNDLYENTFNPLHLAALTGNYYVVRELIKFGIDVNCHEKIAQYTPLHLASRIGHFSKMKDIFGYSGTSFKLLRQSFKHLKLQREFDFCQVIDTLIKAGADVNARDVTKRTPLHYASSQANHSVVEILLNNGAFVHVQDHKLLMPLHKCLMRNGTWKTFDLLVSFGADINDLEVPDSNTCLDEIVSSKQLLAKQVIKHTVKLLAIGLPSKPISDLCQTYLKGESMDNSIIRCLQEIEQLKNENVTSNMSFYDLLHTISKRKFVNIDALPSNLSDRFPIYYRIIEGSYRASCNRKKMLELGKLSLEKLTDVCWPDLCSEHIIQYLSNKALRALIESLDE